jgi:hypothetical protein
MQQIYRQPLEEASSLVAGSSRGAGRLRRGLRAVEFSGSDINRLKITDGYSYSGEGRVTAQNAVRLYAWSPRGGVELKRQIRARAGETKRFGRKNGILGTVPGT